MSNSYVWSQTQAQFSQPIQPELEPEYGYPQQQRPNDPYSLQTSPRFQGNNFSTSFTSGFPASPATDRTASYPSMTRQQADRSDGAIGNTLYPSTPNTEIYNDSYNSISNPLQRQQSGSYQSSPYGFNPELPASLPTLPSGRLNHNLNGSTRTNNFLTPSSSHESYSSHSSPHANQQYYDPISASQTADSPSRIKRQRTSDLADDYRDDDGGEDGQGGQQDNADSKSKGGACQRCKTLKVRCEFTVDRDICRRCLNGGHECVIPHRKKRRTPPKREHLLNQIREQAEQIKSLMAQLEDTSKTPQTGRPPNSAASDTFSAEQLQSPTLSPSNADEIFGGSASEKSTAANLETNKAVEDWLSKAKDSLAEFGGLLSTAGVPQSYIVDHEPEDDPATSEDDEHVTIGDQYEIAVEIEDLPDDDTKTRTIRRHRSSASSLGSTNASSNKKKDSLGAESDKLVTLPSEAVPLGLLASMRARSNRKRDTSPEVDDESVSGVQVGIAANNYFRPSPTPEIDPARARIDIDIKAPHILTRNVVTPAEAEDLFKIYHELMNDSCSIVDPILYTPQRTFYRSPFLFTVICGIASRYYTKRPALYSQAMHYAQLAAGTALISGPKNVELCIGYILLSLYPVPTKRWEDMRSWMYLGLAIRIATELNLHLPNTAKALNENHAREQLNRTRVWLNCVNLDRSTGSQYGKAPIISNDDYTANHSEYWWKSSEYNIEHFDIHTCCYNEELRMMASFRQKIYSDPNHPTGLNKDIDFEALASETDEALQSVQKKWFTLLDQTDQTNPQNCFRTGLLRLAYSYSRLVVLSFGFQHAFGKNNQDENPFLARCLKAASDVCNVVVDDIGRPSQRLLLRHGPDAQSVFVTFASAFLIRLLQPKFSAYITTDMRAQIRELVTRVIDLLSSPEVAIDDHHAPKLYARFLKDLLDSSTVKSDTPSRPSYRERSKSSSSPSTVATPEAVLDISQVVDSPTANVFSYSQSSGLDASGYEQYSYNGDGSAYTYQSPWPSLDDGSDKSTPNALSISTTPPSDYMNPPLPFDAEMMNDMTSLTDPSVWRDVAMPGFSWMSSFQSPDVQMASAMFHPTTAYAQRS